MRSYREYCSVAKALDVIGDRWTLLIIRELSLRGGLRYSDLQEGLPGISTNLLADRLRELEAADVVVRHEPRPPLATAVFELSEHGRGLEPILKALMSWGIRYMVDGPAQDDHFKSRWLTWPAEQFLSDADPEAPPATIAVEAGGEPIELGVAAGRVTVSERQSGAPDATISGDAHAVLGLITGHTTLATAESQGLRSTGQRAALERVFS